MLLFEPHRRLWAGVDRGIAHDLDRRHPLDLISPIGRHAEALDH
jgi:hypothetical protein